MSCAERHQFLASGEAHPNIVRLEENARNETKVKRVLKQLEDRNLTIDDDKALPFLQTLVCAETESSELMYETNIAQVKILIERHGGYSFAIPKHVRDKYDGYMVLKPEHRRGASRAEIATSDTAVADSRSGKKPRPHLVSFIRANCP